MLITTMVFVALCVCLCVCVLVCMCTTCMQYLWQPEEGDRAPGIGTRGGCQLPGVCVLETEPGAFVRVVHAFNHWVISPTTLTMFLESRREEKHHEKVRGVSGVEQKNEFQMSWNHEPRVSPEPGRSFLACTPHLSRLPMITCACNPTPHLPWLWASMVLFSFLKPGGWIPYLCSSDSTLPHPSHIAWAGKLPVLRILSFWCLRGSIRPVPSVD